MKLQDPLPDVQAAFDAIPRQARAVLMQARAQIFEAAERAQVGHLIETLKWGQPSYLTEETKAGSTIRLGLNDQVPAAFFTCSSSLVDGFRADFPEAFMYHGNRALTLSLPFPDALDICLTRALTYHRSKRKA